MPALDISEKEDEFVVSVELPGVDPKAVDVSLNGKVLTVTGEKKETREDADYHRVERTWGSFTRTVTLPDTVDAAKVTAESKNGVLTIRLGKRDEVKPRKIDVELG
jgi:HSP20 family protein